MNPKGRTQWIRAAVCGGLAGLLLLLDAQTPLGVVDWLLYLLLLILVASWFPPRAIYICGAIITALMVCGYIVSPQGIGPPFALLNRVLGLGAIWLVVLLLAQRDQLIQSLRAQEQGLQEQVRLQTEDLKAALTKYTTIFDTVPVGILITDETGRVVETNREALQMLGVAQGEDLERALTSPGWQTIQPDGTPMPWVDFAAKHALREQRRIQNVEVGIVRSDGTLCWINATAAPVPIPGYGAAVGFVDISELKRVEASLRESEQTYRDLYDNSPDMYVSGFPADHLIRECNLTLAQTLGYTREELIGQPNSFILTPASYRKMIETLPKYAAAGEYANLEVQLQRKDGRVLDVLMSGKLNPATATAPAHSRVTFRDVSERKRLETALRKSEEKFAKAFRSSPAAIVISTRNEGRIIDANYAYAELTGYSLAELIGYSSVALGVVEASYREELIAAFLAMGSTRATEVRIVTKTGKRVDVLISMEPIELDGVPCILSTSVDISERKRMEQALRKMNAELERSNRDLDQFAYVASHDLKAPLRAIAHLAMWIAEDAGPGLPPESQAHLAKLRNRTERMARLLDDLLAYSRAGRRQSAPEVVDTLRVVQETVDLLGFPSGFSVEVPATMPVLVTERAPLEIVFRNLIQNAYKHHEDREHGCVTISAADAGDLIAFTVTDNGPGIAPRYHAQVFELFHTLKPRDAVEGSGMGLSIVKRIVEGHGGAVSLASTPGAGAAFTFTWPKHTPSA